MDKSVDPLAQALEHDQCQRNAHDSIKHTEGLASVSAWGSVAITYRIRSHNVKYYYFISMEIFSHQDTPRILTHHPMKDQVNSQVVRSEFKE